MIECTRINKDLDLETKRNTDIDLKISLDKLKKVVEQSLEHMYEATIIFIGHPLDLIEIDMSEIPANCYFISFHYADRGTMCKADGDLKRELYEFIEKHPDRVLRGEKYE